MEILKKQQQDEAIYLNTLLQEQAEKIKQLEKSLEEKEEQLLLLENILALTPGHVYWKDEHGVYKGCNDTQAKFLGYKSGKEILGKTDHELAWAEAAGLIRTVDTQVMQNLHAYSGEETGIIYGQEVTFLSKKVPWKDRAGKTIGVVGVSFDISDRKRIEQELNKAKEELRHHIEEIVALMPGHVYWKDKNGVYLGCNDLQAHFLGYSSGKEIVGKTDYDLPWRDQAGALQEIDNQVMKSGKTYTVEEPVIVNGKQEVFLSKKVPLRDKEGNTIGIIGVSFNITERKLIEKELVDAKERAEEANKTKEDFIHNMEHDIRTPFVGIYTMAEILWEQEAEPEKKEGLRTIVECSKQLLDYCNEILNFSKLASNERQIYERKFEIRKLLHNVYNMEKAAAISKKLQLNFECDPAIPNVLMGDRNKLYRVLINLVSNAVKFTVHGKVTVEAKCVKKLEREIVIRLFVTDTGIGIEESKKDFIYEKFTRIYPSNKNKYEGMGLGLKIVKQFVNDMNGEIDVNSTLGEGSTFICTIPFKIPLVDEVLEEE